MKKLQQFYIFKFESSRLLKDGCDISLTLDKARENGELVSIGSSQVIRSLFRLSGKEWDQEKLNNLVSEKKRLMRFSNDKSNSSKIKVLNKQIDDLLFIPEIVSVAITNKSHYKKLLDKFYINGERYVRLLAGAGNIRRDTIIFCKQSVKDALVYYLDAGRDINFPITPSKYAAYFSLANSATYSVPYPRFCIIPDCEEEREVNVDWVYDLPNGENDVEERTVPIKFNLFDGQGLISPEMSKQWAEELELDYVPATFIVRGAFTKGSLVTFDIHAFCEEKGIYFTTDVWGNKIDLREIDVIFTESQVKLWKAYSSLEDYKSKCNMRKFGYGVSRVSPKTDKTYVTTNYQFLQVLNLNDNQIENLCKSTVDHLSDISGMDRNKMILYCTGGNKLNDENPLSSVPDPMVKALMLNEQMQYDPYIRQHIANSLNKKIRESYIGSLFLNGNYSAMISDPYALMEHCLGLEPKGLLQCGQHYSNFWATRGVDKVVACRAPLTFTSEVNVLSIQNADEMKKWYSYLYTGIVYNCHGNDVLLHSDADFDGDIVFTSSSREMVLGAQGGLPISYNKKIAPKIVVEEKHLVDSDMNGMCSKIGFITNCSSTVYAMQREYDKNSPEYKELLRRSKLFRYFQGENIDKAKNGSAKEMPSYWFNYQKIKDKDTKDKIAKIKFDNSVLIEKRPYFFRYIYPHYNKRYLRELDVYDKQCSPVFKFGIKELLLMPDEEISQEMLDLKKDYYKYSYFLFSDSVMNKICWNMESKVKEYKANLKKDKFDWSILMNETYLEEDKIDQMMELVNKYKHYDRNKKLGEESGYYEKLDIYAEYLKNKALVEISSNEQELASLAVYCTYSKNKGEKEFAWKLFGDALVLNLYQNSDVRNILVSVEDQAGNIEYLWNRYSLKEFDISKEFGENFAE